MTDALVVSVLFIYFARSLCSSSFFPAVVVVALAAVVVVVAHWNEA